MKTISELRTRSLGVVSEVLFKFLLSLFSTSFSISSQYTTVLTCKHISFDLCKFLKTSLFGEQCSWFMMFEFKLLSRISFFLTVCREPVWNSYEPWWKNALLIKNWRLPLKSLGVGSKVKIKSKLINIPRLSLIGKKAHKSDDSIMSYHICTFYITIFYHKLNLVQYFLTNLLTTLKQIFPLGYLKTFTGWVNCFIS